MRPSEGACGPPRSPPLHDGLAAAAWTHSSRPRVLALSSALALAIIFLARSSQVARPGLHQPLVGDLAPLEAWIERRASALVAPSNPAICTLDAFQAALWLATLGISIEQAVRVDCKNPAEFEHLPDKRAQCSERVSTAIASAFATGANLAGTFTACAATIDHQAECAGVVNLLGTSLGLIAAAGSDMYACSRWWDKPGAVVPAIGVTTSLRPVPKAFTTPPMSVWLHGRVPEPLYRWAKEDERAQADLPAVQRYERQIVKCWIATSQAAGFIARATFQVIAATKLCAANFTAKRGGEKCAIDVLSLITSFSSVAAFLSIAAADCGGIDEVYDIGQRMEAKCAADITTIIAAVSLAGAVAVDFPMECQRAAHAQAVSSPAKAGDGRRLRSTGGHRAAWLALLDRFPNATSAEAREQLRAWIEAYPAGDAREAEEEKALFGGLAGGAPEAEQSVFA